MENDVPFTMTVMSPDEIADRRSRGLQKYVEAVRVNPGNAVFPIKFQKVAGSIYNFEFRPDDMVIMSWPKTGSTWLREILWAFTNLDQLHLADQEFLHTRTYSLNMDFFSEDKGVVHEAWTNRVKSECGNEQINDGLLVIPLANNHKGTPRILYTHLQFPHIKPTLLNTCKVIYLARNPKNLCLSHLDFLRALGRYVGDLDTFTDLFIEGHLIPGSYWQHIEQAWELRDHPNMHFMFYEDMRADPLRELTKLNDFLGFNLTPKQLKCVEDHSSYEKMKAREDKVPVLHIKDGSSFYKGGRVGGWNKRASTKLNAKMDKWIAENESAIGIKFKYE